MSALVLKQPS